MSPCSVCKSPSSAWLLPPPLSVSLVQWQQACLSSLSAFSRHHRGCPLWKQLSPAVSSLWMVFASPVLMVLPLQGTAAFPADLCNWRQVAQYLLLWGEGKTKWRGVKATDSFGGCPVLDVVLKQRNSGYYTGLAVTQVTVCCLLACQNLGISISKNSIGTTSLKCGGAETLQ